MSNKEVLKESFTCKTLYGSKVEVADIKIEECNNVNQKLNRSVTATIQLKVSNMMSDMDVLEWNINIPYAEKTTMMKFLDGALDENDVTKSYSLENFIIGIAQGGVVNNQPLGLQIPLAGVLTLAVSWSLSALGHHLMGKTARWILG